MDAQIDKVIIKMLLQQVGTYKSSLGHKVTFLAMGHRGEIKLKVFMSYLCSGAIRGPIDRA